MATNIFHRVQRMVFALLFVLPVAMLPMVIASPAEASFAVCRGDPILKLNDGLTVSFTVELNVAASRVVSVVYTVHAPKSVILKDVQYPKDDLTGKESVIFLRDSPDANFHVITVAHVVPGTTGTVLLTGVNKKIVVTATGLTGQPINVAVTAIKQ